jgi:hypothetical protein
MDFFEWPRLDILAKLKTLDFELTTNIREKKPWEIEQTKPKYKKDKILEKTIILF